MTPQNRERARGERSAQAIGDGVARLQRLQRAGGQRTVSIIRALRLASEHASVCANPLGAQARSAEQSAAADRGEHGVEITGVFKQLLRRSGLSGDDAVVVVGMNEDRAGFRLHAIAAFFAG